MIKHEIDGVIIPYDPNWKNVAISVSGGADSALLAYLICDLAYKNDTTVHIINHIRCWKTKPWQQRDSDYIFNWLFQKFYLTKFKRHINFIAPDLEYAVTGPALTDEYNKKVSGDNIQQRSYAEYICHKHNIDAYYNAVTRNPREAVDFSGMTERSIERNSENSHLEFMIHMGKVVSHPFRFVDKSWVVKQYRRLDLMKLFENTRSCEGVVPGLDYTNYVEDQEVPVCGECFWCKEREWAIERSK